MNSGILDSAPAQSTHLRKWFWIIGLNLTVAVQSLRKSKLGCDWAHTFLPQSEANHWICSERFTAVEHRNNAAQMDRLGGESSIH
jgi:hypothetical protein